MIAAVQDLPLLIRSMRPSDVPAVAAIEKATYEFPWSPGIFRDCLLAGYLNLVLDRESEVVGYAVMSVAAGEAHLLNICVTEALRRQGIGARLLRYLLRQARIANAERMFLEVRPSNRPALQLYRKMGFRAVGVRKAYYKAAGGKEDAVVLVRRIARAS